MYHVITLLRMRLGACLEEVSECGLGVFAQLSVLGAKAPEVGPDDVGCGCGERAECAGEGGTQGSWGVWSEGVQCVNECLVCA